MVKKIIVCSRSQEKTAEAEEVLKNSESRLFRLKTRKSGT